MCPPNPESPPRIPEYRNTPGYITPRRTAKDVNVRSSDIQRDGGYKALAEGQKVEFEVTEDPQDPQAKKVRAVD